MNYVNEMMSWNRIYHSASSNAESCLHKQARWPFVRWIRCTDSLLSRRSRRRPASSATRPSLGRAINILPWWLYPSGLDKRWLVHWLAESDVTTRCAMWFFDYIACRQHTCMLNSDAFLPPAATLLLFWWPVDFPTLWSARAAPARSLPSLWSRSRSFWSEVPRLRSAVTRRSLSKWVGLRIYKIPSRSMSGPLNSRIRVFFVESLFALQLSLKSITCLSLWLKVSRKHNDFCLGLSTRCGACYSTIRPQANKDPWRWNLCNKVVSLWMCRFCDSQRSLWKLFVSRWRMHFFNKCIHHFDKCEETGQSPGEEKRCLCLKKSSKDQLTIYVPLFWILGTIYVLLFWILACGN